MFGNNEKRHDVDLAGAETDLNNLIERRAREASKQQGLEDLWAVSVRRHKERRRKVRAEWHAFFCGLASSHARLAEHFEARALKLLEDDKEDERVSLKRRLARLHDAAAHDAGRQSPRWSPPETYARIRDDAREDIARDEAEGRDPIYRIDGDGIVRAASDGRPVRHGGDYGAVLDEHIRELEAEIAEEEEASEGGGDT